MKAVKHKKLKCEKIVNKLFKQISERVEKRRKELNLEYSDILANDSGTIKAICENNTNRSTTKYLIPDYAFETKIKTKSLELKYGIKHKLKFKWNELLWGTNEQEIVENELELLVDSLSYIEENKMYYEDQYVKEKGVKKKYVRKTRRIKINELLLFNEEYILYRILKSNVKNYFNIFRDLYNLKGYNQQERKFVSNFYSDRNDKVLFIATHQDEFDTAISEFKSEVLTLKNIDKQIENNLIKKRLIPILEKALNEQNAKNKFVKELYTNVVKEYNNKNLKEALKITKLYTEEIGKLN